jgi:hypothetical protein
MTSLSQRLEKTLRTAIQNNPIIPVKVDDGILVGTVKIVSDDHLKHLYRNNELLYSNVFLNAVAIKLANIMALRSMSVEADQLYQIDQEYGKNFVDSQLLRANYQKSLNNKDYERADIMWARYCESRDKAETLKNKAQSLSNL